MRAHIPRTPKRQSAAAEAAIIHIDAHGIPCFLTSEAVRILLYPQQAKVNGEPRQIVMQRMHSLFPSGPLAEETEQVGQFTSGNRRYAYRIYRMGDVPANGNELAAVIIIERYQADRDPTADALSSSHLTPRERQVFHFVVQGFSNREIAESMGISPNTVKAFLRLIMTKLGVPNRFGILAKAMGRTVSHHRPRTPRTTPMPVMRQPVSRSL